MGLKAISRLIAGAPDYESGRRFWVQSVAQMEITHMVNRTESTCVLAN